MAQIFWNFIIFDSIYLWQLVPSTILPTSAISNSHMLQQLSPFPIFLGLSTLSMISHGLFFLRLLTYQKLSLFPKENQHLLVRFISFLTARPTLNSATFAFFFLRYSSYQRPCSTSMTFYLCSSQVLSTATVSGPTTYVQDSLLQLHWQELGAENGLKGPQLTELGFTEAGRLELGNPEV